MSDTLASLIEDLARLLPTGGVAALVATTVVYFLKARLDSAIKANVDLQLEQVKTELAAQSEHIKAIRRIHLELLPSLVEAVYRSRNTARDLVTVIPLSYQADLRSRLGDLALLVTERLYEVRALLPPDLFDRLHSYKTHLQRFVFDYDAITQSTQDVNPELLASLQREYNLMDGLYSTIVEEVQEILRVEGC